MEQQENSNLENVSIKATGLFNGIDEKFEKIFKKNNIKTLKELLSLSDEEINNINVSIQTKNELRGIIELLKYKYLGKPLITAEYLNKAFSFESSNDNYVLIRMGFTTTERRLIYGSLKNEDYGNDQLTYLQVLNKVNTKSPYINEKIRLYLNFYKQNEEKITIESLNQLRIELQSLIIKRDSLNLQIDEIQNQIAELQSELSYKGSTR